MLTGGHEELSDTNDEINMDNEIQRHGQADTLIIESDDEDGTEARAVTSDHPDAMKASYWSDPVTINGIQYEYSKVPYSLRSAINRYPEYEKEIIQAAMDEIKGILDKCLKPIDRAILNKSGTIKTLSIQHGLQRMG